MTYTLLVFRPPQATPVARVRLNHAPDVLGAIPTLLETYHDASHVEVVAANATLFRVDRSGRTTR